MKWIYSTLLFLFSIGNVFTQNISKINSDLKLSDSLAYETEIRIYQSESITNYTSLFRMFKENNKWTAEFYEHYAKVFLMDTVRIEKRLLKSVNDMQFVYQNLLRSHIMDLPSSSEIDWKLVKRGDVEKVQTMERGEIVERYDRINNVTLFLDGDVFKVQAKIPFKRNEFNFSNPDSYLEDYPNIDELIYIGEIMETLRNEFGIWLKT